MLAEVTGAKPGMPVGMQWYIFAQIDTYEGINGPSTIPGGLVVEIPKDFNFRAAGASSYHPGGCFFGMADGSVQFMNESTDLETIRRLTTRDGGEVVNLN
jgi:hypothetical protein